jgi:conserved oligomeric Golgi complex subunit 3
MRIRVSFRWYLDLIQAKTACSYLVQICTDESTLFKQFFNIGEPECVAYLESLTSPLSIRLRPLILQTHRIDVLSDLSKCLTALLDTPETLGRIGIEPILHDCQTRLAFRAESLIYVQVTKFVPKESEMMIFAREKACKYIY